jgi:hypothetical protein
MKTARRARLAMLAVAVAGLLAADPRAATAADPPPIRTTRSPFRVRVGVRPAVVELGQRVTYRAGVSDAGEGTIRLLPPQSEGVLTWGAPRIYTRQAWRRRLEPQPLARFQLQSLDTMGIEVPLQAFALGRLSIPGLRVEIDDGRGPRLVQLPTVTLTVVPVLAAADSNADFRAVHGPLAAPWWERVPWTWVILGLLAVAAIVAWIVWRRRRRRGPALVPVARPEARDPRAEALAALAALRAQNLPERGRFTEHAFELGQILRRYLEAVTRTTRPGDTTPELVAHLRLAGLESDDLTRLAGLLRAWDQVKFAREPFTLEEAIRAERAAEAFLRRPAASAEKAA